MLFTRVDFNVSQHKQDPDIITNTARIDAPLPTIKHALEDGAKPLILCSHLGRPSGEKTEMFSRAPAAKVVDEKLSRPGQLIRTEKGKPTGMALRVPTFDVFVVDLTAEIVEETTWKRSAQR